MARLNNHIPHNLQLLHLKVIHHLSWIDDLGIPVYKYTVKLPAATKAEHEKNIINISLVLENLADVAIWWYPRWEENDNKKEYYIITPNVFEIKGERVKLQSRYLIRVSDIIFDSIEEDTETIQATIRPGYTI